MAVEAGAAVSYKGFRFPAEVISHAVWLYHRFRHCQVGRAFGVVSRFGTCLAVVVTVVQAVVGG
ncbi:hypothetical protein ABZT03_43400, partial [Streptomyces sp. NPDC005574]